MEPRGRGRARGGRARGAGEIPGQQPQRPGPQGAPGVASAPPQGAWARPPQGQQPPPQQRMPQQPAPAQQPSNWGQRPPQTTQLPAGQMGRGSRPGGGDEAQLNPSAQKPANWGQRPPQAAPPSGQMGRGSRPGGGDEAVGPAVQEPVQVSSGGGDVASQARGGGNGGVRGRTNRNEIIHTRPAQLQSKMGSSGQALQLQANYFKLLQHGKWCLFQYRVDFNPDIDDTKIRRRLVHVGLAQHIGGFLFDGTVLYSPRRINPDPMEVFAAAENGDNIKISLRMVNEVQWGDYHYIQLFNIIVRKCLRLLNMQLVGRNYFDPNARINIQEYHLELWPGYSTSIRQHEKDILMNAEVTFKVMRTDNVYDLLMRCSEQGGNVKENFHSKIVGSIVLTSYNNKTYKIDDVEFKETPQSKFTLKDNSQISYMDYYRQKYNINIHVQNQPLLLSRSKPREIRAGMPETLYLIPELCQLTGLTDEQRNNMQLMSALTEHTRMVPKKRIQKLKDFASRMNNCPEIVAEIKRWDLKFAETLVEFQGRVLPMETIYAGQGGSVRYPAGKGADWTKDLRSNMMVVSEKMNRLAVVTPAKFMRQTEEFMKTLQNASRGMQWDCRNFKIFSIPDDRASTYLAKLDEVVQAANPTLIMIVLQGKSADRYSAVKKKCYIDRGVPTQCVTSRILTHKGVVSIATKIAIQMNCKIGGAPWQLSVPIKNLMVVGYDVCRDTASRSKSFSGMVASLNSPGTRYYNGVSEHSYEEELSANFSAFLLVACQRYKETNGVFPEKIIIYRDGVGDGQLPYVIDTEVKNIVQALESKIYTEGNLKMSFIVVSKRINTKIFYQGENPPPGTVVDDVITLPERYDFFIVSQCVRQGTVAPTSYNVIYDTMGLPPDRLQMLTYKLTHMYYNWSGTVRVPAPCQYAHKLAFLVAQSLHRPAHKNLETLLYYL